MNEGQIKKELYNYSKEGLWKREKGRHEVREKLKGVRRMKGGGKRSKE